MCSPTEPAPRGRRADARRGKEFACLAAAAFLAAVMVLVAGPGLSRAEAGEPPRQAATEDGEGIAFVGSETCAGCHRPQFDDWLGSHHRHAMERADEASVRGDFGGAAVTRDGEALTFRRDGDAFLIDIEGEDGATATLEVLYTFGWEPLQQYLVAERGGRLQAFDVAWDTEAARWFDLHPDEVMTAGDPLHWRGLQQTWNFMCADCHSTGLERGYDPATDSFSTTWAEETLGCESCHGAGAAHVAWVDAVDSVPEGLSAAEMGLTVDLAAPEGAWVFADGAAIAHWDGPSRVSPEFAVCGSCHTHRRLLVEPMTPTSPFLEGYVPSLLDAGLYRPDGRQEAEVYILGSFLQSKMAAAGVTCTSCHEPHSGTLLIEGNALCAQCHLPEVFDTAEHHHHETGTEAAQCVSCHMPDDLYMEVDWRRDHGFHAPGAGVAALDGVVDACAACHESQNAWRMATDAGWWHGDAQDDARATAIALGEARGAGAAGALAALAADPSAPAITRATALSLMASNLQPSVLPGVVAGLQDADPLVRLGAVRGLAGLPPADRYQVLKPLIADPVKAVRLEVAGALTGVPLSELPAEEADRLAALFEEMLEAERLFLDRPENNYNIANHLAFQGDADGAAQGYEDALARDPTFVPAYVNFAELQRSVGDEAAATATLLRGLEAVPDAPALHYALGLALYREGKKRRAMEELEIAWQLSEGHGEYGYALALALAERGQGGQAIAVLERSLQAYPNDRQVLIALIYQLAAAGETARALQHARHLAELEPEDPSVAELIRQLGG